MENNITRVAVIGGGPAGLMAAEVLSGAGIRVDLYDAMPTVGRKFLMAGKGGMNITHSEAPEVFVSRYGSRSVKIKPLLDNFGADDLRAWVHVLGISTFVGSSGRVFPAEMKAAPLLRAWLHRLREAGVNFHMRHRWLGWAGESLCFESAQAHVEVRADAVVLATGGGSWARLGSDGAWVALLAARGISVAPLKPSNCGFDVNWSEYFSDKFAGEPLKSVTVCCTDSSGKLHTRQGDVMVTKNGIEGGLIYALSAPLRDMIAACGSAVVYVDLLPGKALSRILAEVNHPRGSRSMSSHLQSRAKITGVKNGLLRELLPREVFDQPEQLAAAIKSLPLKLIATRPLDEAISTAGGVTFEGLDENLMLLAMPGVFCAGEMLDWEAPTGGYLLTACFSSGYCAAQGVLAWLKKTYPA
jgi:uncharacterized flavoprotein (TIGR03862 family)